MDTIDAPGFGPSADTARRWRDDVLVVGVLDQASLARRRLVIALEAHPGVEVVFDGAEPARLLDRLATDAPDVVIVSVTDGLPTIVERVSRSLPAARILVLIDGEGDAIVAEAMARGAIGVLSRRVPVTAVAAAVAEIGAGHPVLDAVAATVLAGRLRTAGQAGPDPVLDLLDRWADETDDASVAPLDPRSSSLLAPALARLQRNTRHAGLVTPRGR